MCKHTDITNLYITDKYEPLKQPVRDNYNL